jgi:hypothetical protein
MADVLLEIGEPGRRNGHVRLLREAGKSRGPLVRRTSGAPTPENDNRAQQLQLQRPVRQEIYGAIRTRVVL